MSNDQLSWDQLLIQNQAPDDSKQSGKTEAAPPTEPLNPGSESEASVAKPTAKRKPRASAKTSAKESAKAPALEPATELAERAQPQEALYSKKNWSKLEFNTKSEKTATVTEKPLETPAPAASATTVQVTKVETTKVVTRVAAPVLPFEDDASADELDQTSPEPQVMSVSELNRHIRDILEGRFPLIWLKGEISNFKAHTSGHFYFSLKDSKAQINAVMFRGFNSQLRFRPEDGMEVLVRGKITVYEPRGNYQIFCEMMEPVGAGALQKAYEQLKAKLQKEGLFDEARKRPLPALPKHIAIVTSPTGAAIRDMLNVLGRRFKGARITVIPCKVQGDQAPREIVAAIALANRLPDVDVMIVGRGGGSIEDLWAFNDEGVARAIAAARVPTISAVGHEVDFTIADFVADLRAPTPSAAAELVVKNAADLAQQVAGLDRALRFAVLRKLNNDRQFVTSISKRLVDPQRRIQDAAQRCDELLSRLQTGMARSLQDRFVMVELFEKRLGTPLARIERDVQQVAGLETRLKTGIRTVMAHKREALSRQMAVLDSLSPLRVLDRGFSMVTMGDSIITDAESLKVGQSIHVRMCHGSVDAQVTSIQSKDPKKK